MTREKLLSRIHIVEGLLRVLDDRRQFTILVGESPDRLAAKDALVSGWGMTEIQAAHALDMPFGRATKLGRDELAHELTLLRTQLDEIG